MQSKYNIKKYYETMAEFDRKMSEMEEQLIKLSIALDNPKRSLNAFGARAVWTHEFAWLPKTCVESGRRIWFKKGYKGTTGVDTRWLTEGQFMKKQLAGDFKQKDYNPLEMLDDFWFK